MHGVVNRKTRSDGAAGRIDVELNVFFRVFSLQEEHLRGSKIGDVIVNRSADEDDVFLEQARINIVSPFAAAGLLDHHGYKCCAVILGFVVVFHVDIRDLSGAL